MIPKIILSLILVLIILIIYYYKPFIGSPELAEGDMRSFRKRREDFDNNAHRFLTYIGFYLVLGVFVCLIAFLFLFY